MPDASQYLEERRDRAGRRYCYEPGQGRVPCPGQGKPAARAGVAPLPPLKPIKPLQRVKVQAPSRPKAPAKPAPAPQKQGIVQRVKSWLTGQPAVPAPAVAAKQPARQVPKPAPQPAQSATDGAREMSFAARKVHEALSGQVDQTRGLTAEKKAQYKKSLAVVVSRMPKVALQRMVEGLKGASFYSDLHQLSRGAQQRGSKNVVNSLASGALIAGSYNHQEKRLHLNGGVKRGAGNQEDIITEQRTNRHETYAHEMTHAIDTGRRYSASKEWQEIYKREFYGGALSRYSSVNATEAFAEFGRLLYGTDIMRHQPKVISGQFKRALAFFRKHGLYE